MKIIARTADLDRPPFLAAATAANFFALGPKLTMLLTILIFNTPKTLVD